MVGRFGLDTNTLDDADFGLDGDSPAFTLDTSTLDGDGKLDGFTFTSTATAASALGGLVGSATALITKVASASANLGELFAEVSEVTVTVDADASASLGAATSSATGTVTHPASGESSLGGLTAAATGTVTPFGSMTAELGPMVASAIGTITPQPAPDAGGGGEPYRDPRPKRKKVEPVFIVEEIVIEKTVKTVEAFVVPIFIGFTATAQGTITFSGEDDDLQVLLMF